MYNNYAKEGKIERFAERAAGYNAAAAENPDLIGVEVDAAKVVKKEFTIRNNRGGNKNESKGSYYSNAEGNNSSKWSLVSNVSNVSNDSNVSNVSNVSNANASSTPPPILFHCPQPSEQGTLNRSYTRPHCCPASVNSGGSGEFCDPGDSGDFGESGNSAESDDSGPMGIQVEIFPISFINPF